MFMHFVIFNQTLIISLFCFGSYYFLLYVNVFLFDYTALFNLFPTHSWPGALFHYYPLINFRVIFVPRFVFCSFCTIDQCDLSSLIEYRVLELVSSWCFE